MKSTKKSNTVGGTMANGRPGKRNYLTKLKAKTQFHRPLINALCTVASMAVVLVLSLQSGYLFFEELTQAFSLVGMLLFVKALSQPSDAADNSGVNAPGLD
ncbi:MAG: hypothetical protein MUC59_15000 [Saprospiraceae bacterium]|nr:hypothetical protein [Saprospiraceae bacterium]